MESVLDKIHDDIQLPDESDENIKQAFLDMEIAWKKAFNTVRPYCGNCDEYAYSLLFSFLEDTLINKFSSVEKPNVSRTFVLLDIIRDEMAEEQWYSMTEMYNIAEEYPEYAGILLRENMGAILEACVQEGYFEEKREKSSSSSRKTKRRYFKKTNKSYLDLKEEKILDR